ncbi:hypothetical protein [Nocardia terpenica]|uniref:Uncharacterized protein n=1 Tax=Nocardia terpenica TaxID=455432 RepID=A0A6G9ZCD0_9NOCA|nr:hypothetical protein [Nocardia terpenica]QIS23051.1 hypothetical protein F6W96_36640 [Nocardia terpenica]
MNPWNQPGQPGAGATVPTDVRTACQLWWAAIGFGVIRLLAGAAGRYADRHTLAQQLYDQVRTQQPQATLAEVELMVSVLEVLIVVFGLGLAAGALAVAHQLRRGKLWARTLFDVAAVVLVLGAVGSMIGLGTVSGTAQMLSGAAAILQAVIAGGAVFLCHRTESEEYFRMNGR